MGLRIAIGAQYRLNPFIIQNEPEIFTLVHMTRTNLGLWYHLVSPAGRQVCIHSKNFAYACECLTISNKEKKRRKNR